LSSLGIILVTVFMRDVHLGIEAVMGNADILQMSDLKMSAALALWNLGFIVLFYRPLKIVSFDQNLARSLGIAANFFHFMLLFLAAAVCISAFRAVGVLLVLSFLTGPFLTARLFSQKLKNLLILTPAIGISASILSVLLSRFVLQIFDLPLSTGGLTACLIGAIYAVSASLCGKKSKSRLDLAS
jgi:manganese/zinc/iron transport system permease protein